MDEHFPDSIVTGYENLVPTPSLPDSGDRHVLAAAIAGECRVLITNNPRDFPTTVVAAHEIEVMTADEFLVALYRSQPVKLLEIVRHHRSLLVRNPVSQEQYLTNLIEADASLFALSLSDSGSQF